MEASQSTETVSAVEERAASTGKTESNEVPQQESVEVAASAASEPETASGDGACSSNLGKTRQKGSHKETGRQETVRGSGSTGYRQNVLPILEHSSISALVETAWFTSLS